MEQGFLESLATVIVDEFIWLWQEKHLEVCYMSHQDI